MSKNQEKKNKEKKKPKKDGNWKDWFSKNYKTVIMAVISLLVILNIGNIVYQKMNEPKEMTYTEFQKDLAGEKIEEVYIDFTQGTFTYKIKDSERLRVTDNPRKEGFKEELLTSDVKVLEKQTASKRGTILTIFQFAIWGLIIFVLFKSMNIGGINIENKQEDLKVKLGFDDIAGNKEAKKEMTTVVDIIQNKEKYASMGAKTPKGAVLYGPPGTGKTLLAKAIAGETNSAFFSINASEFVEKYVGVGASRIRKLFKTAKKNAPAIIFIDEIDAIGGHRGSDNNSEREQTLNQLLSELDGFDLSDDIFVIAATNRLDKLDEALIRPGRFDKHISIPNPKMEERLEILELYAKKIKLDENADLKNIAKVTINMAGASLEALINEAAILAVDKGKDFVTNDELEESYLKLIMKGNMKEEYQVNRKKEEIDLVAWHEAGHAIMSLKHGMHVPMTTILSSTTGAGGVTFATHKKESLFTKSELENYVKMLYAGRVCEYLLYNNDETKVTTGASSDIQQASKVIHDYIATYGLSETFGMYSPIAVNDSHHR